MEGFAPVAQIYAHTVSVKEWFGKALAWVNGPSRAAAFAVLLVVVALFGRDVFSSLEVRGEIRELRKQKQRLEQSIAADSTLLKNLEDPEFLERYAREHYLMRKEGETLYVIED